MRKLYRSLTAVHVGVGDGLFDHNFGSMMKELYGSQDACKLRQYPLFQVIAYYPALFS